MSLCSIGVRTVNTTIAQAAGELRTTASVRARILETSVVQSVATASSYGWGRPAAIGVTPGTTSTPIRDEVADPAATATMALSWATAPTAPSVFARRWNSAATVGVGVVFTFPRGFMIAVSASFVVHNVTATVACDWNVAYDE